MTKMKNLLLSALVAAPLASSAAGMGIYIPFNITETEKHDFDSTYNSGKTTDTYEYKTSPGFGVAFDSNIGKDKLYNYRLGLEYRNATLDTINNHSYTGTYTKSMFNIVNTFGFSVYRNETVRLWIGPRLNIQFETSEHSRSSNYSNSSFGIGIAPTAGVNVSLGKVVALAFDVDYHVAGIAGSHEYTTTDYYGTTTKHDAYSGTNTGITARFYVLLKFGEKFDTQTTQQSNEAVVDQSL